MTSLIAIYPIVVYERDWSRTPFESLTLEEKIEAVHAKRKKASARLATIVGRISCMNGKINESTRYNTDILIELRKELADLEQAQMDEIRRLHGAYSAEDKDADEDIEQAFSDFEDAFQSANEKAQHAFEDEQINVPKKSEKLKKLYRKIANRTHPDKTKDPEKHKLFLAAKEYYNSNNLEGLERIWKVLNGKASSLFDRLFKRLQDALRELEVVEKHLNATLASDDYELLQLFEKRSDIVLGEINKKLEMQIAMLRSHRDSIRAALGMPPVNAPRPDSWLHFEF